MQFPGIRLRKDPLPLVCTWLVMLAISSLFLADARATSPPWDHDPYQITAAYSYALTARANSAPSTPSDELPEEYVLKVSSKTETQNYTYTFLAYTYPEKGENPNLNLHFYYDVQTQDGPQLKRFKDPNNLISIGQPIFDGTNNYTSFEVTLKPGLMEQLEQLTGDPDYRKLFVIASKTDAKAHHCVAVFTLVTAADIKIWPAPSAQILKNSLQRRGRQGQPYHRRRANQGGRRRS